MPGEIASSSKFRAVVSDDHKKFRLQRVPSLTTKVLFGILIVVDIAGLFLVVGGVALLSPGSTQDLATGIPYLVVGILLLWLGVHAYIRRPVVTLTPTGLSARGVFGRTRSVERSQISSIDLKARTYGRSPLPLRVPYVSRSDGTGFWLDALAGDAKDRPVDRTQMDILHEIRADLGVSGSD